MKSKIGKLGKIGEPFELAEDAFLTRVINAIIEKQGEIIDHLNSQDQEEEWYCECGEPANEGEHICDDEYKKVVEDTPEKKGMTSEEYNKFFNPLTVEDTPEERERELLEEINKTLGTNLKMVDGEIKVVFRKSDKLNK